jgi:hypothetical protein
MKSKRNWIVIIPSLIYYVLIISTLLYAITGDLTAWIGKELPVWYNYFIYATFIIYSIALVFILKMRKNALIFITAITLAGHIFSYYIDVFSIGSLIADVIVFGTLWTQYKKMK